MWLPLSVMLPWCPMEALSYPAALQRRSSLQSPRDSSASVRFSGPGVVLQTSGLVPRLLFFSIFSGFEKIQGGSIESQVVSLLEWRTSQATQKRRFSWGPLPTNFELQIKACRLRSVRGWMENFRFATLRSLRLQPTLQSH